MNRNDLPNNVINISTKIIDFEYKSAKLFEFINPSKSIEDFIALKNQIKNQYGINGEQVYSYLADKNLRYKQLHIGKQSLFKVLSEEEFYDNDTRRFFNFVDDDNDTKQKLIYLLDEIINEIYNQ